MRYFIQCKSKLIIISTIALIAIRRQVFKMKLNINILSLNSSSLISYTLYLFIFNNRRERAIGSNNETKSVFINTLYIWAKVIEFSWTHILHFKSNLELDWFKVGSKSLTKESKVLTSSSRFELETYYTNGRLRITNLSFDS